MKLIVEKVDGREVTVKDKSAKPIDGFQPVTIYVFSDDEAAAEFDVGDRVAVVLTKVAD